MSNYFKKLFHKSHLLVAAFVLTPIRTDVIPLRFFFNHGVDRAGSFLKAFGVSVKSNLLAHNDLLFWDCFHI